MTTREKLLLQIFERKKKIIDQVSHHALLFDHHLAFKLLVDGITPPPWLSTSESNAYDGEVTNVLCAEVDALSKGLDARDETSAFQLQTNIAGCASNGLPAEDHHNAIPEDKRDEDPSISSPQDQGCAGISDTNPDPSLSFAKIQRSKSRQRALQIRNSAKKDITDGNNVRACAGAISVAGTSSLRSEQHVERKVVNPLDQNNETCAVEDVKVGDCSIKEKGRTICHDRIMCNKSLELRCSLNNAHSSSHAIQEEVVVNKDSTKLPAHKPDLVNQSNVNHSNTSNETYIAVEAKSGDFQSKGKGRSIYSGLITRSRISTQQANELFELDLSSNNCKDENTECMEFVKSVEITNEIADIRAKTARCQILKNGSEDYSGRITRSRSSSQPRNPTHASQNLQESPLVQKNIKLSPLNTKKRLNKENYTEAYGSGIKSSEDAFGAKRVTRDVTSNNPDQMVTQSMLTASSKSHKANDSSISAERLSHRNKDVWEASSNDLSCKESVADKFPDRAKTSCSEGISKLLNSNRLGCGVTQSRSAPSDMPLQARPINRFEGSMTCAEVKDLPSNSINEFVHQKRCTAEPAEADSICLGSNVDVADCGVRHETLPSRTSTDSTMHMEPKQLDFDIVEEPSSNGIPAPVFGKEKQGGISAKRPITLSEPSNLSNKGTYISIQEKGNSPLEMHLLEQQEALSKDGSHIGLSEAHVEKINEAMRALDGNFASAVREMSEVNKDAVSRTLQKSEKTSKARFALIDNSTNLQASRENFPKSMPRKEDDTRRNLSESIINLGMSNLDAYSLDRCTCDDTGVVSAEHESIGKSSVRSFSSFVEDTWTQNKRRKTEPVDAFYAPTDTQQDVPHTIDDNPMRKDLLIEYCPKTILESFILSDSEEVVAQLVTNRNQVEELHQIEKYNLIEGSESPPNSNVEEAEITLKGRETSANAPCTSMQEVEVSHVSSLTRQAPGDSQVDVTIEASMVNPTSFIIDAEKQWALNVKQVPCCHEADSKLGHAEPWSSTERCLQEERLDLEANSEFPYCSFSSRYSQSLGMIGTDDTMPVLEGFIMQTDDDQSCSAGKGIKFDELKLPKNSIERVSILERLCKSACLQTPGSCSSAMYKLHRDPDLYQSVPTGLLEGMNMRNKLFNNNTLEQLKDKYDCLNEVSHDSHSLSEYLPCSSSQSDWDLSKPCISPVSKLWDRITSISGSSEKRGSLMPELPCIEEENENIEEVADTYQEGLVSDAITNSAKREPLADITENMNRPASEALLYTDRYSLDSPNTEFSLTKTHNRSKKRTKANDKRAFNNKEKHTTAQGGYSGKRGAGSLHDRSSKVPKLSGKSSLRKGGPSFSEMETTHNNIVSNITSFIPLVQQKQAAAVVTGKRDIKVKALEAAEAAKLLAEKKENERKLKKEAMKLERTRLGQENLRQMELQKKRKEEERKKNEADMAAKKRQREEEERKEKRKRMRIEESRRQQREQEQKLRAGKEERQATDGGGREMKKSKDELEKQKKTAKLDGGDNLRKTSETEPLKSTLSTSDERRAGTVNEQFEASSKFGNKMTVLMETDKPKINDTLIASTSQEQSYEISPYKASDDEDEDEDEDIDDLSNKKYVPSWASKSCLALVVSSQTRIDPEVIFPPESFCNITEVLLPRKLQIK